MTNDDVLRGEHARRLIEDPLLSETLDTMERATLKKWETSSATEAREELWHFYRATKLFRQYLQSTLDTGHMAYMEQECKKRFKLF